uniref:Uncharacterized protein n=1 Tax=Arundo donax TaxID=35708 RepID=A0A0A9HTN3_ARUDO
MGTEPAQPTLLSHKCKEDILIATMSRVYMLNYAIIRTENHKKVP